jgi:signal transduction histidine kinase
MDVERLHAGKVVLSKQRISVQKMLRAATEALQHRCEEKQLQLDIIAPEVALWIDADPARLQQVFMNLLDNAIKYTPSGGRIWITASTEDVDVVIHFQDDGVGIPEAMLSRIFELFTQVRVQDAPDQSGLGIGLALVKELVELHGGSVQAASNGAGHGSVFTVRLPLAPLHSHHLNQRSS